MHRIFLFDDYPVASETLLFRSLLEVEAEKHSLNLHWDEEKSFSAFERRIREIEYDILILDIMAKRIGPMKWNSTGHEIPEDLTGIGILQNCRLGKYGHRYRTCPIFMRSARGEPYVVRMSMNEGANAYHRIGVEDKELVDRIVVLLKDPMQV